MQTQEFLDPIPVLKSGARYHQGFDALEAYLKSRGVKARHLTDWRARATGDGNYYPLAFMHTLNGAVIVAYHKATDYAPPCVTVFDTATRITETFTVAEKAYNTVLSKVAQAFGRTVHCVRAAI